MLKLVTVAALVALGATSAVAQTPPAKAPAPAAKAQEPEKRRCERTVEETGSRVGGRKVCKTEAEWAAERQQKPKESERGQDNAGNAAGS